MLFQNPSIKVAGVIFQNKHGSKYYSHYYLDKKNLWGELDLTQQAQQRKFQNSLRHKAQTANLSSSDQTEIFTLQSYAVLFKQLDELQVFVVVPDDENIVLMEEVANTIVDSLRLLTNVPFTGKVIFDHLQDIVLVVDEILHEGYIVCLEAGKVYDRLRMKDSQGNSPKKAKQEAPQQSAANSGFSSLFGFAKNTFNRTLNLG